MATRFQSAAGAGLLGAAVVWAALVVAAPSLGRQGGGPVSIAAAAGSYLVGAAVCHQRPERTFHLAGAQLPVCARCTGLYLSTAIGILVGLGWLAAAGRRPPAIGRARASGWRPWLLAAALPTAASVGLEWAGLWPGSNGVRAAAAVPFGLAVGLLLAVSLSFRGKLT
ncbi:MAG TPA: DUF2085 domain-containing protein [Vicinamibacterales bacterium]|nr:DUF2085 domain-containing protein [Vicinamibacterales bacterium]